MLTPPVVFIILLLSSIIFGWLLTLVSFKRKDAKGDSGTSYACGENSPANLAQPDYSQFFPFAFFFTILHVFTLTIATIPVLNPGSFAIAIVYALAAIISLVILFARHSEAPKAPKNL